MARGSKKDRNGVQSSVPNPEASERQRLKKLALSKNIISESPADVGRSLSPSKTVLKHHGKDILRKSQRKSKYLFSFPGLFAPITGGKIGELKDLGTKNPILYLEFPQGRMKLFGTIIYPKNRYLTLQFSRGGKNVMCENSFDNMIVFSDAWWIGTEDENPEETRIEFPKELSEGQHVDFIGGAGSSSEVKLDRNKTGMKNVEQHSSKVELEDGLSNSEKDSKNLMEMTPVRHSARSAGKSFNFAEGSSGDESVEDEGDLSEGEKRKVGGKLEFCSRNITALDLDDEDVAPKSHVSGKLQESAVSANNIKLSPSALTKSKKLSRSSRSSLVQPNISTLFKKVEEKRTSRNLPESSSTKVSGQKRQHIDSKEKTDQAEGPAKKARVIGKTKAGTQTSEKQEQSEAEDDDIEEISSASEDTDGSDEDWAA